MSFNTSDLLKTLITHNIVGQPRNQHKYSDCKIPYNSIPLSNELVELGRLLTQSKTIFNGLIIPSLKSAALLLKASLHK